jgi:type III pantothenate kinase
MCSKDISVKAWVGLAIGNSRLHWGQFQGPKLLSTWDTKHLTSKPDEASDWQTWQALSPAFAASPAPFPELLILSVVPAQTFHWLLYVKAREITLKNIPLPNMYGTLGVDRALALWGAGTLYGWPVLLIDSGTALTLTGADSQGQFVGGSILPGFAVQARSLHDATGALPQVELPESLPIQWAKDTQTSIQSGLVYNTVGGLWMAIQDWCVRYSESKVVLTGGDAQRLLGYLQAFHSADLETSWQRSLIHAPTLLLNSLAALRAYLKSKPV